MSQSTTLFGGFGNDSFTVYHNKAELFLFGEEDDDTFRVRAFVRVNPNDPKAPFTNINGGQGADFIAFTVNAPVHIEGGDGFDTLTVVGTEFGDDFVVNDAGRVRRGPVRHLHRGGEGGGRRARGQRPLLHRAAPTRTSRCSWSAAWAATPSTSAAATTATPITVVSNEPRRPQRPDRQHRDDRRPGVQEHLRAGHLGRRARQRRGRRRGHCSTTARSACSRTGTSGTLVVNSYQVVLTRAPEENVTVSRGAGGAARERAEGRRQGRQAGTTGHADSASEARARRDGVTLTFTRANWFVPQTVYVFAPHDTLAEGTNGYTIVHRTQQGSSAEGRRRLRRPRGARRGGDGRGRRRGLGADRLLRQRAADVPDDLRADRRRGQRPATRRPRADATTTGWC